MTKMTKFDWVLAIGATVIIVLAMVIGTIINFGDVDASDMSYTKATVTEVTEAVDELEEDVAAIYELEVY